MFKPGFILFIVIGEVTLPSVWCFSDGTLLLDNGYCRTAVGVLHNITAQTTEPSFTIQPSSYNATAGEIIDGEIGKKTQ